SIPSSFQPEGIVSVAAVMLFSDGSVIVAVIVCVEIGAPCTYVAPPAFPDPDPEAAAGVAAFLPEDEAADASFGVEEQPAIKIASVVTMVNLRWSRCIGKP